MTEPTLKTIFTMEVKCDKENNLRGGLKIFVKPEHIPIIVFILKEKTEEMIRFYNEKIGLSVEDALDEISKIYKVAHTETVER